MGGYERGIKTRPAYGYERGLIMSNAVPESAAKTRAASGRLYETGHWAGL